MSCASVPRRDGGARFVLDKRADRAVAAGGARRARRDGQKVLLGIKNRGGARDAAWRAYLAGVAARGLGAPELAIVAGAPGLEAALAALWPSVPVQRCTVHKHRNLLAHAPKRVHGGALRRLHRHDLREDGQGRGGQAQGLRAQMAAENAPRSSAAWKKPEHGSSPSLRYPPEQVEVAANLTNAVERLHAHEEFKRRIKTQCLLPCADTACMLFWALPRQRPDRPPSRRWLWIPSMSHKPSTILISPPELTNIADGRCRRQLSYQLRDTTAVKAYYGIRVRPTEHLYFRKNRGMVDWLLETPVTWSNSAPIVSRPWHAVDDEAHDPPHLFDREGREAWGIDFPVG